MPTGSKGMINQLSNMVAPQVNGQGKNDTTWKIVTGKRAKKQGKGLFDEEDFPPLPEPSPATSDNKDDMDTSSDKTPKHSPARAKTRRNMAKITPDIDNVKTRIQRAKTDNHKEDDKSTISSSSKGTNKGIDTKTDKDPEEIIKSARRSLRIKQKQEKLKKRMMEEEKLNKIIKKIENEHISSFFGDDDSDPSTMDYSSDSTLESHHLPDECTSLYTGPRVEVAFAARTSPTLLQNNALKQKHQIKQEDIPDPQKIDDILVQSDLIRINDEIKLIEEIKTQEEHAQSYIGNHRSTLKQEELREWARDTTYLKDKTDYTSHICDKLPRLHDQAFPSSLREFAFLGSNLRTLIDDWKVDGVERGAELERG